MPCDVCTTPTTCKLVGCEKGKEYELAHPAAPPPPPAEPDLPPPPPPEPDILRVHEATGVTDLGPEFPSESTGNPDVETPVETSGPQLSATEPSSDTPPGAKEARPAEGETPEDAAPQGVDKKPDESVVRDQRRREAVPANLRARLDQAVELAHAQFPDALRIRPGLHGMDVYVEVWDEHAAKLYALSGEIL